MLGVGTVVVKGEITNYKAHSSGHRYFTLKDEAGQISCTLWRGRTVPVELKDGMKVIVTGDISVYPMRGNYQLDCISITPLGVGDLYIAFEALKKKLEGQGFFASDTKKPIPKLPLSVGISTSPTGAAIQDMFSTIGRRFPLCRIYFRPTLVQGDGADTDIVSAIRELEKRPVDVIIIGRGGGSIEDLWSYNTEIVANAIFNCNKPIISAVGHETDFTIADFVADKRAATPTAAAELVTPQTQDNILSYLYNSKNSIQRTILKNIDYKRSIINNLTESYSFRQTKNIVQIKAQQLDDIEDKLNSILKRKFGKLSDKIENLERNLLILHPLSPLKKGFAILKYKNKIIHNDISLKSNMLIEIQRETETVKAKIESVFNELF